MTAANLIVRERAAYLLTDSATLRERDRTVLSLRRKVVASPGLRMAITGSGETFDAAEEIKRTWLAEQADEDAAVTALPLLVAMLNFGLKAHYRSRGWPMRPANDWPPPHCFHLYVAMWSEARRRPEGYAISSRGQAFYPHIEVVNGCVYRMAQSINPPAEPCEDPERDGLALLERQRAIVDEMSGAHIIGGTAQLTKVSEAGVTTTVLREWPDEIGRRIQPNAKASRAA
jgi:hypothetical protein